MIVKSSVIKKIGYFDENFFYGPDDLDFCLRAGKAGFTVLYNGFAKSVHVGSTSYHSYTPADNTKVFGPQVYGNLLFQLRHFGVFVWLKFIMLETARVFVTKKRSYIPATLSNLTFHLKIPLRTWLLLKGMYNSIRNKHKVVNLAKIGQV